MGIDFNGYFQVDTETLDLDKLSRFFERNHLQYQGYSSYYELQDYGSEQYLSEISADVPDEWSDFMREAKDPNLSPNVVFFHEEFDIELGFFSAENRRYAVLSFTGRSLDGLEIVKNNESSNVLEFILSLYQALNATSLVWGLEISYNDMLIATEGVLDQETILSSISLLVGESIPPENLRAIKVRNGRYFKHGHITGVAKSFIGFDFE